MGVLFVIGGTFIGGMIFLGAIAFMLYMLIQMIMLLLSGVGAIKDNTQIVIHMPKDKAVRPGRAEYGVDRGAAQEAPFFADVSGVDLEYRGVGTAQGRK
jgi:hypothetical protein